MSLSIAETVEADVLVVSPGGRLDTMTAGQLEALLFERIDGGRKAVLLDLCDLDYISSNGLRVLLKASKRAADAGARFALCGMKEQIRGVFDVTGFNRIITVHRDRTEGVANL